MANESCRVLVVDDNRDAADSAVMLLASWGHEAVATYSADEALKVAPEFDPDVALVDIGLPVTNGFRLAEKFRRAHPDVKLVALTGFTREDIVRRSRDAGFDVHLTKPAAPGVLKAVVESHRRPREPDGNRSATETTPQA